MYRAGISNKYADSAFNNTVIEFMKNADLKNVPIVVTN